MITEECQISGSDLPTVMIFFPQEEGKKKKGLILRPETSQESDAQGIQGCGSAENVRTPEKSTLGQRSANWCKERSHTHSSHRSYGCFCAHKLSACLGDWVACESPSYPLSGSFTGKVSWPCLTITFDCVGPSTEIYG